MELRNLVFVLFWGLFLLGRALWGTPTHFSPGLCDTPTRAEEKLACGRKISLAKSSLPDLLLIPFVSDTLASEITTNVPQILATASSLPESQRYKALLIVPGIGKKRAKYLDTFLEFP